MRIFIVIDATVVLCGGVLTGMYTMLTGFGLQTSRAQLALVYPGILSACELLHQLSLDRLIPQSFCKVIPVTNAPYIAVLSFMFFSGIVYASTGASLVIVSKM